MFYANKMQHKDSHNKTTLYHTHTRTHTSLYKQKDKMRKRHQFAVRKHKKMKNG